MTQREQWPSTGTGGLPPKPEPRKENAAKRFGATIGFLADASRRRPGGRRVLWVLVALLAMTGVGMMGYPFATQMWAKQIQKSKAKEFAGDDLRNAYKSKTVKKAVGEGEALTRLEIPSLKVDVIVVEGVSGNALRAGAGHYPESALPGDVGNVAIAGHRTGFGQPFRYLDRMKKGDTIVLSTPLGEYTYKVMGEFDGHPNPWITHALDWTVIGSTPTPVLTLTTCDPPHTSKNRLIVRAELVKTVPVG